ncbi:MAG: 3-dehydroquinate synthase [Lentisphaerae bacterium GWF2_52_8]|nr:MAG: 3-dehydroquinate synthase [Lentisphaerae bacterium GWF2_52_8]
MTSEAISVKVALSERSYDIIVQPGVFPKAEKHLRPMLEGRKCLIVSDSNVYSIYADRVVAMLADAGAIVYSSVFQAGEESKTLDTVKGIYHKALTAGLDRKSLILALGGGVSGDIAGFAAATFMRGIDFIQVPTTLLAMVDSSVGGKTGVDLPEGKNLIGAFWQPRLVLIDPKFLRTLPERERRCGLAEIVKTAVILDEKLFKLLEDNAAKLEKLDIPLYCRIVARCCELKGQVVAADERETTGLRAILNYGHSFGHAVETLSKYSLAHGEAVSIGMCMAADLSAKLGLLSKAELLRQDKLLKSFSLPTRVAQIAPEAILDSMRGDKKSENAKLRLVLPDRIGHASVHRDIDEKSVLEAIGGRCD